MRSSRATAVQPERLSRLDIYGQHDVYTGEPTAPKIGKREHRYLVWYGGAANGTGWPTTYRTLFFAKIRARLLQGDGYHVRISDRLIREGDARAVPLSRSFPYSQATEGA
jgi:hypothetical protein